MINAQPCLTIILILLLCAIDGQEVKLKKNIFPHRLWTYWNSHIESAPIVTQLCVNTIRKTAEANNWQLVLLSSDNIHQYLSQHAKSQLQFIQSKTSLSIIGLADLYRLFILHDHGGMWLDTNSFFVQDLTWIEQIDHQKAIYNKLSSEPEMIMFSFNDKYGGNRTVVYDVKRKTDVVLFPGLEIWSFIAKPKAEFLRDVLEGIVNLYKKGTQEQYLWQSKQLGYKYNNQDSIYFIYSNHAFQTILQRKQREIQSNASAFTQQYAIQYYNIWCIDAIQGVFQMFEQHEWLITINVKHLFYSTLEDVVWSKDSLYFIKLTGQYYWPSNYLLQLYFPLYCLDAATPIPENSIFNQFLLKPNQEMDVVKQLREMQRKKREGELLQCEIVDEQTEKTLYFYLAIVAVILLLVNAAVYWSVRHCCRRAKKTTPYQKISFS